MTYRHHVLRFPRAHNNDTNPNMSGSDVPASDVDLVLKKGVTSATSSKPQYFSKYARNLFLLKVEITNLCHHLRQKYTTEYNQARKAS